MKHHAFQPFQRVAAILTDVHTDAVQNREDDTIIEPLAAAMNLAIRFSLPGESRCPKHEALAIALLCESLTFSGFNNSSLDGVCQYLRGVIDA